MAGLQATTTVPAIAAGTKEPMVNLHDYIDLTKSTSLNNDAKTQLRSILVGDGVLKSDADVDAQLLIFLTFKEAVKIRGFQFFVLDSPISNAKESGPKVVKVWVDRSNLDFAEASQLAPTQQITINSKDLEGSEKPTILVKYTNVHSLTIFIERNQRNSDVTILNRLGLIGCSITGMQVANIKKIEDE